MFFFDFVENLLAYIFTMVINRLHSNNITFPLFNCHGLCNCSIVNAVGFKYVKKLIKSHLQTYVN